MNYPVADLVIRIKNSSMANRKEVVLPFSNLNREICKVLVKEQVLQSVKENEQEGRKSLLAVIKYEKRMPTFSDLTVVSKPSLRIYVGSNDLLKRERKGVSMLILSTSQGVMTSKEARKKGVGGELLFEVW